MNEKMYPLSDARKKQLQVEIDWLKNKLSKVSKTKHRNDLLRQIKETEYNLHLGQSKHPTP